MALTSPGYPVQGGRPRLSVAGILGGFDFSVGCPTLVHVLCEEAATSNATANPGISWQPAPPRLRISRNDQVVLGVILSGAFVSRSKQTRGRRTPTPGTAALARQGILTMFPQSASARSRRHGGMPRSVWLQV